ncbi:MAG: hypothetical protein ACYDCC_12130 [Actinomycetota bacterium]
MGTTGWDLQSEQLYTSKPSQRGFLTFWGSETTTPPASDPFASGLREVGEYGEYQIAEFEQHTTFEGGCRFMKRFVSVLAALGALAAIFLVAGAGSSWS